MLSLLKIVMKMSEVTICPACGFSFRYSITKSITNKIVCPMCGYVFHDPNILRFPQNEDDKKIV